MPEELHNSVQAAVALTGDVGSVLTQLADESAAAGLRYDDGSAWWSGLRSKCETNRLINASMAADASLPLNYYAVLSRVHQLIPKGIAVISLCPYRCLKCRFLQIA